MHLEGLARDDHPRELHARFAALLVSELDESVRAAAAQLNIEHGRTERSVEAFTRSQDLREELLHHRLGHAGRQVAHVELSLLLAVNRHAHTHTRQIHHTVD